MTNNVSGAPIDSAVMISDEEAVAMVCSIIVDLFICKVMYLLLFRHLEFSMKKVSSWEHHLD